MMNVHARLPLNFVAGLHLMATMSWIFACTCSALNSSERLTRLYRIVLEAGTRTGAACCLEVPE